MTVWQRFARRFVTPVDRPPVHVEHTAPPADRVPTGHVLVTDTEARIAEVDARLNEILAVPASVRADWMWLQLDRLLDMRNAIRPGRPAARPSVPVVPGGAS